MNLIDQWKVIQSQQQREKNILKRNRISWSCGITTKGLIFVSWVFYKERRKNVELKKRFEEIVAENFIHFEEDIYVHIQEVEQTPNRKIKEMHATHHTQVSETLKTRKNSWHIQRETIQNLQENNDLMTSNTTFSSAEKRNCHLRISYKGK